MERRFKGLVAINDVLDDRYQKLSDKYHDLELSHNRKKRALEKILGWAVGWNEIYECNGKDDNTKPSLWCVVESCKNLIKECESALWSDGRERQVPVKKKKITMATVKARKK